MSELFRTVSVRERKLYYTREWRASKVPAFIRETLGMREMGFDHDGNGPSDRKNVFYDERDLEDYVRLTAPYAVYSSIALYDEPREMRGWKGAELVFDIDAKDLPLRRCGHGQGEVCPVCLEDAKELALDTLIVLKEDFGLENVHVVYSGRGYHVRALDEWVMELDSKARERILAYVSAAEEVTFEDLFNKNVMLSAGYFRVFRLRFGYFIRRINGNHLASSGLTKAQITKVLENREKIYHDFVRRSLLTAFPRGVGYRTMLKMFHLSVTYSRAYFDGRVTVDVKRILRLPSSLHSKVGMIATYVGSRERDVEKFNPFVSAVPKFRRKEVSDAYKRWLEKEGSSETRYG